MMNPLTLYPFLDESKLLKLLVPVALVGLIPLADFYLLFRFGYLIGSYLSLFLVALSSFIGIFISAVVLIRQQKNIHLLQNDGVMPLDEYNGLLGSLIISILWIIPGFLGKIIGLILFFPLPRIAFGRFLSGKLGIDWQAFYEYIKVYQTKQ